jgi:hypothetical protein
VDWTFPACMTLDVFAIICWLRYFSTRNRTNRTTIGTILETFGFSLLSVSLALLTLTFLLSWWSGDLVGGGSVNSISSIGFVLALALCAVKFVEARCIQSRRRTARDCGITYLALVRTWTHRVLRKPGALSSCVLIRKQLKAKSK